MGIPEYKDGEQTLMDLALEWGLDLKETKVVLARFDATKTSKMGNRKVNADGYTFDSEFEYSRYLELLLIEKAGMIRDLRVHPLYVVFDTFKDRFGRKHRAIEHEVDFEYREGDQLVVEDSKGFETEVWKIKRKLFCKRYPEIEYRVIKKEK